MKEEKKMKERRKKEQNSVKGKVDVERRSKLMEGRKMERKEEIRK